VSGLVPEEASQSLLLPVLPLREVCLFPEASLTIMVARPSSLRALEVTSRSGGRLVALGQKDQSLASSFHSLGTLATVAEDRILADGGHRVELDGLQRAKVVTLLGTETLVAEVEILAEGDPGDEWGPAVEALARYLHSHGDLRIFLDQQRRSKEPMAWVNLACQHLPITATARQRLLEANAVERCQKIGRGLDALLRKEKAD